MTETPCRPLQTLLARALYDNNAELPQELTFKRGEILTVIKQNPEGYDGWWICNLRGKVGIAPGNRLDILGVLKSKTDSQSSSVSNSDGSYEIPEKNNKRNVSPGRQNSVSSDKRSSLYENLPLADADELDEFIDEGSEYCLPRDDGHDSNRSSGISMTSHRNSSCVLPSIPSRTPSSTTSDYIVNDYLEAPLNHSNNNPIAESVSSGHSGGNDRGKLSVRFKDSSDEYYNMPSVSINPPTPAAFSPPTADRDLNDEDSGGSGGSSAISGDSGAGSIAYSRLLEDLKRLSLSSCDSLNSGDIPQSLGKPIRMTKTMALERFGYLQQNLVSFSNKLFRFIHSRWKTEESLNKTASVIQPTCQSLVTGLHEFLQFVHQLLDNAAESPDKGLSKKLWKHVKPLDDHSSTLASAVGKLDMLKWNPKDMGRHALTPETDYLSSIVNTTRNISIEVRSLTVAVHGNASLLFPEKQSIPTSSSDDFLSMGKRGSAPLNSQFESRRSEPPLSKRNTTNNGDFHDISSRENQTLKLYYAQIESHCSVLVSTIDDFIKCLERNQLPNVFVVHSKFLLKSATQLIYIANGLCNGLELSRTRTRIEDVGNSLCATLKIVITDTKSAATEFPSSVATQKLIDSAKQVKISSLSLKQTVADVANAK